MNHSFLALLIISLLFISACSNDDGKKNSAPSSIFTSEIITAGLPLSISLDASLSEDSDGEITTYQWDFGDGSHAEGINTSHTYTNAGSFVITLTVTDNKSKSTSSTASIEVNAPPITNFTATPVSGNIALTVELDASTSSDSDGSIVDYQWDFGDGGTATGLTTNHTYVLGGDFDITLITTDDDGDSSSSIITINVNTPPSAAITATLTAGNAPLLVSFSGDASIDTDGSISNYQWDFGDGNSGSGASTNHIYNNSGNYTASLTVTDNSGASHTATQAILVNALPTASFNTTPTNGSSPLNVSFDASGSSDIDGSIASYQWDFGDGSSGSGLTSSHVYTSGGSYTAILTVTDNTGGSASTTQLITVNASPNAAFTATPSSGAAPLLVNFDATNSNDSDGSITNYQWNFGDGSSASGITTSHSYSSNGSYTASLTVTDNNGASNTNTQVIRVNILPTASFTATPTTGSTPLDVSFDASGSSDSDGSIYTYLWDFGDGSSGTGLTSNHTYTTGGIFTARLTVTDNNGGKGSTTQLITIKAPPTAAFTATPNSGTTPLLVSFDASSSSDSGGSITNYQWDFGDGNSASGLTSSHIYTHGGNYTVTLSVTDNDGSSANTTQLIAVNIAPSAAFTATPDTGQAPLLVSFDASNSSDSDGSIASYQWDFGDSSSGSGATIDHSYNNGGSYTATLTVTDNDGASNNASIAIHAFSSTPVSISGTISAASGSAVDSDTNDSSSSYTANDSPAQAQPLSNPVLLGGYATATATGVSVDRFAIIADPWDGYQVSLIAGQTISLEISDWSNGGIDMDLELYDISNTLVDSSIGITANESLTVASSGDYYIVVHAIDGGSNYTLQITESAAKLSTAELKLSSDFMPDEIIVEFAATNQSIATQASSLALQAIAGKSNRPSLFRLPPTASRAATYQTLNMTPAASQLHWGEFRDTEQQSKYETLLAIKALRQRADVLHAEPNYLMQATATPNDSLYASQWHYPLINLPQAWELSTGSVDVSVAVIDTGVYLAHPDLTGQLLSGYDFISNPDIALDGDGIDADPDDPGDSTIAGSSSWHGTHVAGTIAASSNNNLGVSGIAWNSKIMPLRVLGFGGGTSYDIQQAIRYAAGLSNDSGTLPISRANVINMSLGCPNCYSNIFQQAVTAARNNGTIIIAAAGNENSSDFFYPAAYNGVISVSAVNINKEKAPYSNYGSGVDVAAPGGDQSISLSNGILSTLVDESSGSRAAGYEYYQGTSMAAPHVAGIVALMSSLYPTLTPDDFDAALIGGHISNDLGAVGRDDLFGYGLIDALKAVEYATALAGNTVPSSLSLLPSYLDFLSSITSLSITLSESGSQTTSAITTLSSASWLTVSASSVDTNGLGDYHIQADRTSLSDGPYSGTISFSSDTGAVSILQVGMRVGTALGSADTGHLWILLMDKNYNLVDQLNLNAVAGVYDFAFNNVTPANYYILAGTDSDNDLFICDSGEACGAYSTVAMPNLIPVTSDTINIDFITTFNHSLGTAATGVTSIVPTVFERTQPLKSVGILK